MHHQNYEYATMVHSLDENVGRILNKIDNIPDYTFPAGYSIRWYRTGYEKYWQAIITAESPSAESTGWR